MEVVIIVLLIITIIFLSEINRTLGRLDRYFTYSIQNDKFGVGIFTEEDKLRLRNEELNELNK